MVEGIMSEIVSIELIDPTDTPCFSHYVEMVSRLDVLLTTDHNFKDDCNLQP